MENTRKASNVVRSAWNIPFFCREKVFGTRQVIVACGVGYRIIDLKSTLREDEERVQHLRIKCWLGILSNSVNGSMKGMSKLTV